MDYLSGNERRPPRSTRPGYAPQPTSSPGSPLSPYEDHPAYPARPPADAAPGRPNVSFQHTERGQRSEAVDGQRRPPTAPSAYQNTPHGASNVDLEDYDNARVGRKKSLVRPDREKIEPGHRQWHYRTHVAQMEETGGRRMDIMPSTTGNQPQKSGDLRRGRSLLGREEDVHESGLSLFKRGTTLRRKRHSNNSNQAILPPPTEPKSRGCCGDYAPGPKGPWMFYCFLLTCWIPTVFMRSCGLKTPEQQRAWREKMGLMSIVAVLMAGVGFLTFGFTETVCGTPSNRFHGGAVGEQFIGKGSVTRNGYDYDLSNWNHPAAGNSFDGESNPLLTGSWDVAGNDISFLFQNTNGNCLGLITKSANSSITGDGANLDWYFPCNVFSQWGDSSVNQTNYEAATSCHTSSTALSDFSSLSPQGEVYLTWDDVNNSGRNLAVYQSSVLDLSLLNWLSTAEVEYPDIFDEMKAQDGPFSRKDITMHMTRTKQTNIARCLEDTVRVAFIDTSSIGCVASEVVLIVSLVFIIGVVAIRFIMAVIFTWFFARKMGNFPHETYEQRMQRSAEIENWSNDIYRAAPSEYRPNVAKGGLKLAKGKKNNNILPSTSRFTPSEVLMKGSGGRPTTAYGMLDSSSTLNYKRATAYSTAKGSKASPPDTPLYRQSRATTMFDTGSSSTSLADNPCPFPLHNVVPQPPHDYEPFNFPLAHTICLVTAYSESVEGLRTTLDSLATTDYPNSHKLILIIADGLVKGSGNDLTTPEICVSMMKDFIIQPQDVEPHSYVAIADGHKRHNMAKVYAGFYDYDDATVERSKQQRVPIVLVAKCGNPLEANESKPGNRGKRDSQIVLMAFLQKVMFDERMTTFEYEFFNSIWRVTGVSPDRYEMVLCVDADTKAFPDSLSRMVACMVNDEEIMGLCGETKIANKADTFVTMMQVFEYYISHHMTKAFESMFGGVTCLPGCFSMYRIKAPKGDSGYWVPILANPDIVEHYSENVVDTLHKKNLLLLGEDRYLTTLMLKTFPKRKNMFCPAAVCKTVVPDTFRILLSQRRRWINSTIHNLAELVLVRDLCGTFCFSMQFVVAMELAGTMVLPAAIAFTLYLIIDSIIPGGTDTTIPLVLLAVVLGLPGLLIVVTSRKIAYIGWMLVYLISLPIWNGILPAYSFWHFDDFSWGQTRKVEGTTAKDDLHGDKEGEFDSTHIVMKKWAEFERERRWKSGTQSRDSYYQPDNRNSLTSASDLTHPQDSSTVESASMFSAAPRQRQDSNNLLSLPAPLAGNRQLLSSGSSAGLSRASDDTSDNASSTHHRLIASPQSVSSDPYASDPYEDAPPPAVKSPRPTRSAKPNFIDAPGPGSYSSHQSNPFNPSATASPVSYESPTTESDVAAHLRGRGVSLMDSGPVPAPDGGVRRVSRQQRRQSTQAPTPTQNRYSRNSAAFSLPPGAAPPSTGHGQGH